MRSGRKHQSLRLWGMISFLLCTAPHLHAQQHDAIEVANRIEFVAAVSEARPGTRILIAPGEYHGGLMFSNLQGTKLNPIVIEAKDAGRPPVISGGGSCLQLRNPEYVELRNLILKNATGNGLNIDDGGQSEKPASNIVLQNIHVREIGAQGNEDGIKLSGVDDFVVDNCTIERWGERGSAIDMVGCHNGQIKNCVIRFRSDIFGNGVQTKGGTSDISIQRCRFDNAGSRAVNIGGSTGKAYFRPRNANYEAKNIVVEDCTFVGASSPIVFVGVDGATVRYNTIYRPTRWVIRILQESQGAEFVPCRNGIFSNNIIAFRSDEVRSVINVGGGTSAETFRFNANHWYCIDHPQRSDRLGLPTTEVNGNYGLNPMFRDAESGDFALTDRSRVRDAGVRPK